MRAFAKRSAEGDEIVFRDVPQPEPGSSELLIQVHAIGVGIQDGYFFPASMRFPYVVGIEAAGVIVRAGSSVSGYRPGERVAFVNAMQPKGGTWAEFTVVDGDALIVRIPDALGFEEAAAVPVAGNTAIRAMSLLDLQSGDGLFVAGGSGAIGTLVIQMAAARGYRIAASASPGNHRYLESLGAEKVVDYRERAWQDQVRSWMPEGVDAAIAIQPGTAQQCEAVVKTCGTIVSVSGDQFLPKRDIMLRQLPYDMDVQGELQQLIEKIASGDMQIVIERVFPFAEGLDALAKTQTRHARGKSVLSLSSVAGD